MENTTCMRCVRCGLKPKLINDPERGMWYECPICREGPETLFKNEKEAADAWDYCMSDISKGVNEFKNLYRAILGGMLVNDLPSKHTLKRAGDLAEEAFTDCHDRAMNMIQFMDRHPVTMEEK